ncbi:MAG: hydantoinase B/oxoprolinase family protein [Dehalococcoidia bacterium]|nr:hydantoinase B/oxoprolinase family protein [Dehalococcoidia bacterium]
MTLQVDPLTFGVVWNGLIAASEEMGTTLRRSAYSLGVREGRDFSAALFDRRGRLIAQGNFSPGHLGSMPYVVKHVLKAYPPSTLEPGDGILLNDPHLGSGHKPDVFLISPVFWRGGLAAFAVTCAHMVDVGGTGPGSQAVGVTDTFQEGIHFPPVKLYRRGEPNNELFEVLKANVRLPDRVVGDVRAQRNATRFGELRFLELVESYGMDTLEACIDQLLDRSEAQVRAAIRDIPDGDYTAEDFFDDYGEGTEPLTIRVTVRVRGDGLTFDFTGSSPQSPSGINSLLNYTRAYCVFSLKCLTVQDTVPQNEGCLRPMTLIAPEGSLFNPRPPAACGPRAIMQQRIVDTILLAMAPALPHRVIANSSHWANPNYGGIDPRMGKPFVFYEIIVGGIGGRPVKDGADGLCSAFNLENIPVEVNESQYPIRVERLEFVRDSGGPGSYRGGTALRKDVRVLAGDVVFSNLTDRHRFSPRGLFGGRGGPKGRTVLNPGTPEEQRLHSKGIYKLNAGDVVSTVLSGTGGYGDPLRRDPEDVLRDARNGFVSPEAARRDYGVAIDAISWSVDEAETARLRRGE